MWGHRFYDTKGAQLNSESLLHVFFIKKKVNGSILFSMKCLNIAKWKFKDSFNEETYILKNYWKKKCQKGQDNHTFFVSASQYVTYTRKELWKQNSTLMKCQNIFKTRLNPS